jgi:hypothetical protein
MIELLYNEISAMRRSAGEIEPWQKQKDRTCDHVSQKNFVPGV